MSRRIETKRRSRDPVFCKGEKIPYRNLKVDSKVTQRIGHEI